MSRTGHSANPHLSFAGNRLGRAFLVTCLVLSIAIAFSGWWPLLPALGALVGAFGIRGAYRRLAAFGIRGAYRRLAVAFPAGWMLVLAGEAVLGRHILATSTVIAALAGLGSGPYVPIVVTALVAWLLPSAGFYFGRSMRGLGLAWLAANPRAA
ncbi:MAG: hypothetical protein M0Z88_00540, partial [Actinomycetota bacterium]|nr:hypothetical protein [Actinomycetota bacterium]